MTKQDLLRLCEERDIDPQDAFDALAEATTAQTLPDLHSIASVAAWLDEHRAYIRPASPATV